MDFHIICVGQSMGINGMSSCRQLKPHSLNIKSIVNSGTGSSKAIEDTYLPSGDFKLDFRVGLSSWTFELDF